MGLPKLWGKDKSGSQGFVFSHVKTIYYNWASKILLKTKLDEMDAFIDTKIAKAMMSNQQVNDVNKVPTSALVYGMGQNITENANDIAEINGNFSLENSLEKFAVGKSSTIPVIFKTFHSNNKYYQIALRENSVDFGKSENGNWTNLYELALKSDLSDVIKPAGTANLNANNVKNLGIYDVLQSSNTENYPTDDGNGILLVLAYNPNRIVQMFIYFEGTMWTRMYWHGTWRSWFKASNNV